MGTAGVETTSIVEAMAPGTMYDDEPPVDSGVESQPETNIGREAEPVEREAEPPADEVQPGAENAKQSTASEEEHASYEDLLPARQQKGYSDELLNRAAEKFGVDPGLLDNQGVRSLLKGKIDSDILIASREREAEIERRESAATKPADQKKPETQTEQKPTELSFPQIAQMTRAVAEAHVTEEGAALVGPMLYKSLSNYADAAESGDEAKVKQANRDLTTSLMQFGVMMMAEMSPTIFAQQFQTAFKSAMEREFPQVFESAMERYEGGQDETRSLYDEAAVLLAKEPGYRDLAALRSQGAIDRVSDEYFNQTGQELSSLKFRNRETGEPLAPLQNAMEAFRFAVRLIRGEQYQDPADVARRGVEAGRRRERASQNRTALGRFSSGRQSGGFERGGDDAEDFMGRMTDAVGANAPMSSPDFLNLMLSR